MSNGPMRPVSHSIGPAASRTPPAETARASAGMVRGGETNDVLATVGLCVSISNLPDGLLAPLGFGSSREG